MLVFALLMAVALGVTGCIVYNSVADDLPDPTKPLKGLDQTTKVVDRNGQPIAELFAEQNRTNVKLEAIPAHVRQAVIATEDERYYEHKGLDFIGILRALWTDIKAGDAVAGGSTITQQYVKTAFMTPERTVRRKVSEAILAYRLEKEYSKDEILEMYLNTVYFGHGSYGIQTASKVYFGKDVGMLTVPEAAVLAGVLKSPRRYSPFYDMEASKNRRDTVLGQMRDQAYLDETTYAAAVGTPLTVVPLISSGAKTAPYFVEYLKERLIATYGQDQIYRGGLKVTTTLDLRMQAAAEAAIAGTLDKPEDPSAALVAVDPKTGEILAMVGGRDFATQQYNVAAQGGRQTGSSFKTFVLATALAEGVSPEQVFESGPISIPISGGPNWEVTGKGGPMRLRAATVESVNAVFAQLIMQTGPAPVADTARTMGITTRITPVPAIALGGMAEGITPLQMAAAYGTLANGGVANKPYGIAQVVDGSGTVLYAAAPTGTRAIDPAVAYLTTDILKGVISSGTGKKAAIGRPAAGKTGTTQNYSDAWFVGYTPQISCAVWVGYPDAMRPMTNVHGIRVTGGSFPAQIWASFMKAALDGQPKTEFARPKGLQEGTYCKDTGLLANDWCPNKATGLFLSAHPPDKCEVHKSPDEITIPDVVGMTKADAIAALQRAALKYAVQEKPTPGVTPGQVTGQDPPAGSVGTSATVVTIVVSTGSAGDKAPVAAFDYSPKPPSVADPVKFDASSSTDDGTITKYVWEFGDTTKDTTSGKVTSHTYATPGTYEVTLWVTDDTGHTSSVTHKVTVN